MALDERARHTLYNWMQETADDEKAQALMASLPPTGWPELATKQDVGALRLEMEAMGHRLEATFHRELTVLTRTYIAWTGVLVAIFGTLAAAGGALTAVVIG